MMRIRISEGALADLDDGYWFYELQESGLGDYFAITLSSDIEGLKITAGIHRKDYRDYHRVLSRIFPYAIYPKLRSWRHLIGLSIGRSRLPAPRAAS